MGLLKKVSDIVASFVEDSPYRNERLKVCRKCEYSKRLLGKVTCGKPLDGEKIIVNGQEYELCGCVMHQKAKLYDAQCPLKKWLR